MTKEEICNLINKLKHEDITEDEADMIYNYMAYGFDDKNYSEITKLWLEEVYSQVSKGRTGMFLTTFPIDALSFPKFFNLNNAIVEAIAEKMPIYDRIVFYKKSGDFGTLADGSVGIQRAGYFRRYDRETLEILKNFKPVKIAAGWRRNSDYLLSKEKLESTHISKLITSCVYYFIQRQSIPYFAAEIYPSEGCVMTRDAEAEVFNDMGMEIFRAIRKMMLGSYNLLDGIPRKYDWSKGGKYTVDNLHKVYEKFSRIFTEIFYSKLQEKEEQIDDDLWQEMER